MNEIEDTLEKFKNVCFNNLVDKIANAFNTIKQVMVDEVRSHDMLHKISNNAASRFIRLYFKVNTNNGEIKNLSR